MVFQDWILPIIFSIMLMAFGVIWALRLRRSNSAKDSTSSVSLPSRVVPHGEWVYKILYPLVGAGIFFLSWLSYPNLEPQAKWAGLMLMGIGILWGLTTFLGRTVEKVFHGLAGRLHTTPVQMICLVSALPFVLIAGVSSVYSNSPFNQSVATFSWGLGVIVVIWGGWVPGNLGRKLDWRSVLWFTTLTAVAFLLRGIRTSHIPVSLTGDEGDFALWAYQMFLNHVNNLFEAGVHGFPTLYMFIQTVFIRLLGPTSQAIRLSSALIGALTVGCTYWVGKSLFNHRVGVFAGIFLAFFHFHIHFSRLGLNNIWDGFWYVVVLGAFWEGWLTRKRTAFILAGLGLGFSQYFYASARLLPFILLLFIFILALTDFPRFRKLLREIGILFFAALIVFLPLALYFLDVPNAFFDPMRETNIFGIWNRGGHEGFTTFWSFLLAQLYLGFFAYTSIPVVYFYDPGIPLLHPVATFFFVFGLFVLVFFHRNAKAWLILFWLVVIALVGALSKPTPSAQRYVAAAPALALVIGVGLVQILAWAKRIPAFRGRNLFVTGISFLTVLGFLFIGVKDLTFYFLDFRSRNYDHWKNTYAEQILAEHLVETPGEWQVVYMGAEQEHYVSNAILKFLYPRLQMDDWLLLTPSTMNSLSPTSSLMFIFLPEQEPYLHTIQQLYPNGETIEERGIDGKLIYWLYRYQP